MISLIPRWCSKKKWILCPWIIIYDLKKVLFEGKQVMSVLCWTGSLPVEIWQITLCSAAVFFKLMCLFQGGESFTSYKSDRIKGLKTLDWSLCRSMLHFFIWWMSQRKLYSTCVHLNWFRRVSLQITMTTTKYHTIHNTAFIYEIKRCHKW